MINTSQKQSDHRQTNNEEQFYSFQSINYTKKQFEQSSDCQQQCKQIKSQNISAIQKQSNLDNQSKQNQSIDKLHNYEFTSQFLKTKIKIMDFDQVTKQLEEQAFSKKNKKAKKEKIKKNENLPELVSEDRNQQKNQQQKFQKSLNETNQAAQNNQGMEIDLEKQIMRLFNIYDKKQKVITSQMKMKKQVSQANSNESKIIIPQINSIHLLQTLIGSCYVTLQNEEPKKCKYEISINQFSIKNFFTISLKSILKIKVLNSSGDNMGIKINYKQPKSLNGQGQEVVRYISESPQVIFTIFSSLIVRRLLIQQIENDSKPKQVSQKSLQGDTYEASKLIEGTLAVTSYLAGKDSQLFGHSSLKDNKSIGQNYFVTEMIYKKSKHLKKWSRRYVQIKDHKLNSFKPGNIQIYDQKNHKCLQLSRKRMKTIDPTVSMKRIDELWTRFQFYQSNILNKKYLIVKTHHFNMEKIKIEFAIPIVNYANIFVPGNWLYGFYMLFFEN